MPNFTSYSELLKFKRRVYIFAFLTILVFVLLIARLVLLQLIETDLHRQRSRQNHERYIRKYAERGLIYDRHFWVSGERNKSLLVENRSSFYVALVGFFFAGGERNFHIIQRLSEILDISTAEIMRRLRRGHLYEQTIVADDLPFDTYRKILEEGFPSHAVICADRPVRVYRHGKLASHVLGYVRPLSKWEYEYFKKKNDDRFDRLSVIGKAGIERYYDSELRGQDGIVLKKVDAGNTVHQEVRIRKSHSGHNMVLTIDSRLQRMAEKLLAGKKAAMVVLDPATGEILAMASSPDYDPNIFLGSISREDWDRLMHSPDYPLMNRTISGKYPPSSTYKIIAATTLLHPSIGGRAVNPYEKVKCEMVYQVTDTIQKKCLAYHGWINIRRAIAQSCNIYFYKMTRRIGVKRLIDISRKFGVGQKTGIDLPAEVSGFLPTPKWKRRRLRVRWFTGDTLNMSIGQGFVTITPLQNACFMASIINNGVIYKPHVLKAVYSSDNKQLLRRVTPQVLYKINIEPQKMQVIRDGLKMVTKSGTASHSVRPKNFPMSGKTGTADFNKRKKPHAWFVGYAPNKPNSKRKLVVSVIVEEGGHGGTDAAPIACAMLRGALRNEENVVGIYKTIYWGVKRYYYNRQKKLRENREKVKSSVGKDAEAVFD
jgi:penicillin-binding protein 2